MNWLLDKKSKYSKIYMKPAIQWSCIKKYYVFGWALRKKQGLSSAEIFEV